MTTSLVRAVAHRAWPLALSVAALFAGCSSLDPAPPAAQPQATADAAPPRTIGDFSAARRCMDNLLLDYGTRDLTVMVEDVVDRSKQIDPGTREMLIAAVSDMTQRSRAIRLVAQPLATPPQYTLRGSIVRPDKSELSLDLALLTTQDMSVVPGMASRNAVTLRDGGAELHKFGLRFSVAAAAGEGQAQALRALVELSSIELFGRLAKVPYWTCVGITAADATVAAEIQDWYDVMAARPAEIIGYFQQQLRTRRVYNGPIDGAVNEPFKDAVARYRAALGLSREPQLSLDFFKAYLGADHRELEARVPPAATTFPVNPGPLALHIAALNDARRFARGEAIQLTIRPSRDAHVYCYLQDEHRKISRFFPNRFQRDSRVEPTGVQLPGAMRFEIVLNPHGVQETVACFATERDVLPQLPAGVNAGDFDPLQVASLDQLRNAFAKVSGGALAQDSFQIRPK
jgi:hypothetical protein